MQDKFNAFFGKYNNQAVEAEDPTNLYQCFDLAFAWVDFINIPREAIRHLNAYQIYTDPNDDTVKYFELIPNTPSGIPQVGDLVIFGTIIGPSGHVSIATGKGNTNNFTSFDQNWNGVKHAQEITHQYAGVLGWLRVRQTTSELSTSDFIKQELNDIYMGLCDQLPSNAEIAFRLDQLQNKGKNMVDIINEILSGDDRFKKNWIKPAVDMAVDQIKDANLQQTVIIEDLRKQLAQAMKNQPKPTVNNPPSLPTPQKPNLITLIQSWFKGFLR